MSAKVKGSAGSARSAKNRKLPRDPKGQVDSEPAKPNAHLSEVDRELFNIRIKDLEEKLARATEDKAKSELDANDAKKQLEETLKDSEDVVRFLQRSLKDRDDERQELLERLHGLQLARETEKTDYENRLTNWRNDYENLEQRMVSEIKLLQGKLTSLEEFRLQREELNARFAELQRTLREKEEELPLELDRMERSTLLRIDELKQQHKAEIEKLSGELERSVFSRLKTASRRALEENTILLKDIAFCSEKLVKADSQITDLKNQVQGLKELLRKSERKIFEVQKRQKQENTSAEFRKTKQKEYEQLVTKCATLERDLSETKAKKTELKNRCSLLETSQFSATELISELSRKLEQTRLQQCFIIEEMSLLKRRLAVAQDLLSDCLKICQEDMSPAFIASVMTFLQDEAL